jgi:hypothetical protein
MPDRRQIAISLRPIFPRCNIPIHINPDPKLRTYTKEPVQKVDCDEDGNGGDGTVDCLRFFVATKSRVVAQRKLRGL